VPFCELDSLVGVVRQEDEGEPDSAGGIFTEMLLIRGMIKGDEAAALLSADSHLVFSLLISETVGLPCRKINDIYNIYTVHSYKHTY
jgi:hypothetical protein